MKRILLSIFIIFFSFVGCGGSSQDNDDTHGRKKEIAEITGDTDEGEINKLVLRFRKNAPHVRKSLMEPIGSIAEEVILLFARQFEIMQEISTAENRPSPTELNKMDQDIAQLIEEVDKVRSEIQEIDKYNSEALDKLNGLIYLAQENLKGLDELCPNLNLLRERFKNSGRVASVFCAPAA
ncbi:hypothetical protein [Mycoavidus sp. SF9855]|uniref:hypothetical protein n=1 Tax=Mycoavidus sp. SF9855 TaxID=2968475 RepID=UPI00211BC1B8|nr:hypothetical protein [Mycoavidus sp. SF9855]UUM21959.1 hypothetical protein NQD60_02335 [Mycoavidus sp. SF9855]